jgi:aminopeptidase N
MFDRITCVHGPFVGLLLTHLARRYEKGGSLIQMLRTTVTDAVFRAGVVRRALRSRGAPLTSHVLAPAAMRQYLLAHSYSSVTASYLWQAIA